MVHRKNRRVSPIRTSSPVYFPSATGTNQVPVAKRPHSVVETNHGYIYRDLNKGKSPENSSVMTARTKSQASESRKKKKRNKSSSISTIKQTARNKVDSSSKNPSPGPLKHVPESASVIIDLSDQSETEKTHSKLANTQFNSMTTAERLRKMEIEAKKMKLILLEKEIEMLKRKNAQSQSGEILPLIEDTVGEIQTP